MDAVGPNDYTAATDIFVPASSWGDLLDWFQIFCWIIYTPNM